MKQITLFTTCLLLGLSALAQSSGSTVPAGSAQIITAIQGARDKSPKISFGFSDSSFDYDTKPESLKPENKTICYVGDANAVCPQIRSFADSMTASRSRGNHDDMYLHSCEVKRGTVKVNYWLTDDYGGDWRVNRDIKSCN